MFGKSIITAVALAAVALAQGVINSPPSVIQCVPVQLTWTIPGTIFLSVIPGGQPSAAPLVDFGQVSSSPYTWTPNLAAGTSITLRAIDSAGAPFYSSPITIQAGSTDSCLNASATSAAASAGVTGATSGLSSVSAAASSAAGSASMAMSSAATSASMAVSSAANSASRAASSAASAAASGASSARSAALSGASSAAASATSTGAASKVQIGGVSAVLLGLVGALAI